MIYITTTYREQLFLYILHLRAIEHKTSFEHEHLANVRAEYISLLAARERGELSECRKPKSVLKKYVLRPTWLRNWKHSTSKVPYATCENHVENAESVDNTAFNPHRHIATYKAESVAIK